jgi:L-seryl-tRNA(Ser) seleniumtransferase
MNRESDRAARMQKEFTGQPSAEPHESPSSTRESLLRGIPSVDEMLVRPRLRSLCDTAGRGLVTEAIRSVLADVRAALLRQSSPESTEPAAGVLNRLTTETLEERVAAEVRNRLAPSLHRVINATGVILHTNLGRAPISAAAISEFEEAATRYSNLEYDLASGRRGQRDVHTAKLLAALAGAEAAIAVNNNAAAVFLVLHTLAKGAEVIVSRGELIEIGDGFRIPDIMAESGAVLREVGTTNRTRIGDYERALNERTRLLLRVHPSNFRMTGFTERPTLEELVALGQRNQIPVYEDLGSGCLADLSAAGISEPVARASSEAGVSLLSFSGDKLLGGPQAGIIAGKKDIVGRIRRNPLFRALRVDKLTIAALEATLKAYHRGALDEIPALRMIRLSPAEIGRRASQFAERLRGALPADISVEPGDGFSVIGGGSTPDQQLPTKLIALRSARHSPAALDERLRQPAHAVPVVARVTDDQLVLDLRTVFPDEEPTLAAALISALAP